MYPHNENDDKIRQSHDDASCVAQPSSSLMQGGLKKKGQVIDASCVRKYWGSQGAAVAAVAIMNVSFNNYIARDFVSFAISRKKESTLKTGRASR
ncbi:hypothetical protein K492DRAFT_172450 [Lichtheimia hyalospora FSU 10163]|nr:hypothetical protein K492DRAFT_172450 [Lichtheimia hyalospora FSU 10163]